MRQAIMTEPGIIKIQDAPVPSPGPGEVLVRVRCIGVCGSDIHVYHGRHPFTSYPVVQGHEFSGVVEAVGPGVADFKIGEKVTATPQIVCSQCRPCRRGDYHICDVLKVQGFQAPGCAQEFFVTKAEKIVPLPNSFTFVQGALVEPSAVAVHAVNRAGGLGGINVAVLGAGPIGNLVGQVARAEGTKVLITDLSDFRLGIAQKCGFEATSNAQKETIAQGSTRIFGNDGFDVAFECVGIKETINSAIETIQKGGKIVVVGVFGERPRIEMGLIQDRELNLVGTLMYKYEDFIRAVELIGVEDIITDPLDTKHFPFEQYKKAYEFIDKQRDRSMKVFIDL